MGTLYKLAPKPSNDDREIGVGAARVQRRHHVLISSFLAIIILPIALSAIYFFVFAQDRYSSYVSFTVRADDSFEQIGFLSSLTNLPTDNQADASVVYDFLTSPEIVNLLRARLDLVSIVEPPTFDPLFWTMPDDSVSLAKRWRMLARISMDSRSGVISIRFDGFSGANAKLVASAVLEETANMLTRVTAEMREEATHLAKVEVTKAESMLTDAQERLTRFRAEMRIVDPMTSLEGQMGLIAQLQAQLVDAQIAQGLLASVSVASDPRRAQAQRNSRYLAVHVQPTLPDVSEYPKRWRTLLLIAAGLLLGWVVVVLMAYGGMRRR